MAFLCFNVSMLLVYFPFSRPVFLLVYVLLIFAMYLIVLKIVCSPLFKVLDK